MSIGEMRLRQLLIGKLKILEKTGSLNVRYGPIEWLRLMPLKSSETCYITVP